MAADYLYSFDFDPSLHGVVWDIDHIDILVPELQCFFSFSYFSSLGAAIVISRRRIAVCTCRWNAHRHVHAT